MNDVTTKRLNNEIVELQQQVELNESNYKYALELQKDWHLLLQYKEQINYLKSRIKELDEKLEEILKTQQSIS